MDKLFFRKRIFFLIIGTLKVTKEKEKKISKQCVIDFFCFVFEL